MSLSAQINDFHRVLIESMGAHRVRPDGVVENLIPGEDGDGVVYIKENPKSPNAGKKYSLVVYNDTNDLADSIMLNLFQEGRSLNDQQMWFFITINSAVSSHINKHIRTIVTNAAAVNIEEKNKSKKKKKPTPVPEMICPENLALEKIWSKFAHRVDEKVYKDMLKYTRRILDNAGISYKASTKTARLKVSVVHDQDIDEVYDISKKSVEIMREITYAILPKIDTQYETVASGAQAPKLETHAKILYDVISELYPLGMMNENVKPQALFDHITHFSDYYNEARWVNIVGPTTAESISSSATAQQPINTAGGVTQAEVVAAAPATVQPNMPDPNVPAWKIAASNQPTNLNAGWKNIQQSQYPVAAPGQATQLQYDAWGNLVQVPVVGANMMPMNAYPHMGGMVDTSKLPINMLAASQGQVGFNMPAQAGYQPNGMSQQNLWSNVIQAGTTR
jgi:hypothetical protein